MNLFIKILLTLAKWVLSSRFNMFDIIIIYLVSCIVYPLYGWIISTASIIFFTTISTVLESILTEGD